VPSSILRVLTAVFWVTAPICVAVIAASSFTESTRAWLSWMIGVSLLVVMLCPGGIAWIEFRKNPLVDTERGEWTNKMLFYALVFTVTLFVANLYLPTVYFAR
jgi:hypothetical protein